MLANVQSLIAAIDASFAALGFHSPSGTAFLQRRYDGLVNGRVAFAELSVITPSEFQPGGYILRVVVRTSVAARWIAGNAPLLLRSGMTPLTDAQGELLRAHDPVWARRFVDREAVRGALRWLLARVTFVEHRPNGELQLQIQRFDATTPPELEQLLRALTELVSTVLEAAAPTKPPFKFTDNRGLALALLSVLVIGAVLAAVAAFVHFSHALDG